MPGAPALASAAPVHELMASADRAAPPTPMTDWAAVVLAATLLSVPAIGVPGEEMLQDTLKSMVVCIGVLTAALLFFWVRRGHTLASTSANGAVPASGAGVTAAPRWHPLMALPLGLMAYALGSMAWSHTYLAGVEAIRWFIFSLLLWLGLNTFDRERLPLVAHAIHWGAVVASLWAVLQFLVDFGLFAQGPNPASTFVNRNFFAEYLVCTLPFSVWVLATARGPDPIALRALLLGVNLFALMTTGTRSALLALVLLALLLPVILYRYRVPLGLSVWTRKEGALGLGILLATVVGLGSLPTGNAKIIAEKKGYTAMERTVFRLATLSGSEEFKAGSGSIRLLMWRATGRMILDRPLSGVGAGAWEVEIPRYQAAGSQLETDFYAHNEYLQLLAEYGGVGALFLITLLGYLGISAWLTWRMDTHPDAPFRAIALASLLALLLVSGAGFAWRMASTGAIFAVALAILAASDGTAWRARMPGKWRMPWGPLLARTSAGATLLCLALAVYLSVQAVLCERKIITAAKMALTIEASGEPGHARWDLPKAALVALAREGIAINPHYRKITPLVADSLARWGDWPNAVWIWESVLSSRPYVVAILSNVARGKSFLDDSAGAQRALARAQAIDPLAPSVQSLEVLLLSRAGQQDKAIALIRQYLNQGSYDGELLNAAYTLGSQTGDWPLAILGMELRNQRQPRLAVEGWLRIGNIYLFQLKDEAQALRAYRKAVSTVPAAQQDRVRQQVPQPARDRL